jgi:HK97 family phage portal protein
MRLAIERSAEGRRNLVLKRTDAEPLEGTRMSLFNSIIPSWWTENGFLNTWYPGDNALADRVWVSNRCKQLNAQQIASMPLTFNGPDGTQPAWMTSPDPNWYPNGIGDAMFAIVDMIYGYGFSCLYVTDFYATGYPRTWTVLDSSLVKIKADTGTRTYKYGESDLDETRVVQIDRNPGPRLHGTSAITAYAQVAWGLLAAGNQSMTLNQGGIPLAVIKSAKKLDAGQAQALQTQWMDATQRRNGAPPVLPPDLDFEPLGFNPKDLALLESQSWSVAALATAFGVPVVKLNQALTGGLTYQNPLALMQDWWFTELRPMSDRIEDALSQQMLPAGQSIEIDSSIFGQEPADMVESEPAAASAEIKTGQQTTITAPQKTLTAVGGGT